MLFEFVSMALVSKNCSKIAVWVGSDWECFKTKLRKWKGSMSKAHHLWSDTRWAKARRIHVQTLQIMFGTHMQTWRVYILNSAEIRSPTFSFRSCARARAHELRPFDSSIAASTIRSAAIAKPIHRCGILPSHFEFQTKHVQFETGHP